MQPVRVGLLVFGAVVVACIGTVIATRDTRPTAHFARPLAGPAEQVGIVDAADLAALVVSLERLVESLERNSPSRLGAVSSGTPRQPVTSSDETSILDLLREQNDKLGELHAALLADRLGGGAPAQQASILRATVAKGQRPTDHNAWAAFFAQHPPESLDIVPVEVAILGVAEILERFGWPKQVEPPRGIDAYWQLDYRDLELPTPDGMVTRISVYCSRDATYILDPSLKH